MPMISRELQGRRRHSELILVGACFFMIELFLKCVSEEQIEHLAPLLQLSAYLLPDPKQVKR